MSEDGRESNKVEKHQDGEVGIYTNTSITRVYKRQKKKITANEMNVRDES